MIKFLGLDALTHLCAKLKEYVDSKSSGNDSLPVGAGCDYYGATAPNGFMFADGSAISRTEYAELFAIIGTVYGAGDGSTTFNLPDKRSRVSVMVNPSDTNFASLGKKLGASTTSYTPSGTVGGTSITKAQLPSYTLYSAAHTHTQNAHRHYGLYWPGGKHITLNGGSVTNTLNLGYGNNTQNNSQIYTGSATATNQNTTITVNSGGSGQTHTHSLTGTAANISTIQSTLVCNYIIKVTSNGSSAESQVAMALEGSY